MKQHSAAHTSFTIERLLNAAPARVFKAWADPAAKQRWADCHADGGTTKYSMDFRTGGREIQHATLPDGKKLLIEKVFLEITENARITFAYTMTADGRCLSASLVTVQFPPAGAKTHMRYTEQLAYLDGHDDLDQRIKGTNEGLDRLALELAESHAC